MTDHLAAFNPRAPIRLITGEPGPAVSVMGWWAMVACLVVVAAVVIAMAARARDQRARRDLGFGLLARRLGLPRAEARALRRAAARAEVPPIALLLSDRARARACPHAAAVSSSHAAAPATPRPIAKARTPAR